MEAKTPLAKAIRSVWPLIVLAVGLMIIVAIIELFGDSIMSRSLTEALIRLVVVIGLYIFIGNSGLISFGHIAFMMIGAYATAWQTCCPMTRSIFMPGLPTFLMETNNNFVLAVVLGGLLAAIVAFIAGIALMRLSGIAASIGTFAFFMICYSFYRNWSTWTAGSSSVVGIPFEATPWVTYFFVVATMVGAFIFSQSRFGLALRASREDEIAAQAAGINVKTQRLIAFVISAFFVGMAGGLFGHFLGMLAVDAFYLNMTFITLAMLVVGGMRSLSGAVVGVVVLSFLIETLRAFEAGYKIAGSTWKLPGSSAEVGLGIIMLLILIFRPSGITRNTEIYWPWKGDPTAETATRRQS